MVAGEGDQRRSVLQPGAQRRLRARGPGRDRFGMGGSGRGAVGFAQALHRADPLVGRALAVPQCLAQTGQDGFLVLVVSGGRAPLFGDAFQVVQEVNIKVIPVSAGSAVRVISPPSSGPGPGPVRPVERGVSAARVW
jgi:hypothetical protein